MNMTAQQFRLQTANSRRSRSAQKGGEDFERHVLQHIVRVYQPRRMMTAQLHALPTRAISGGARRIAGKAPYDIDGTLGPGTHEAGRAAKIECKSNKRRMAALKVWGHFAPEDKTARGGIRVEQLVTLIDAHDFGAAVCVLWKNGSEHFLAGPKVLQKWYDIATSRHNLSRCHEAAVAEWVPLGPDIDFLTALLTQNAL